MNPAARISVFRPVSPAGEMAALAESASFARPGILFERLPARSRKYTIYKEFLFE